MWFFLVSSWPNVKIGQISTIDDLFLLFIFSFNQVNTRLFFSSSISLVISKFWWVFFSKISWIYSRLCKQKISQSDKSCFEGVLGGEEITIHFCVIWVRNYSLFKLQGIINCRPEAEILVQSFQLVHPISLVLNPSWWVTRFHKDVFLHIRCHVKYHNPTLVVMYLLCRDVSKSVAWRVHSTYIYVYKLCQFVK